MVFIDLLSMNEWIIILSTGVGISLLLWFINILNNKRNNYEERMEFMERSAVGFREDIDEIKIRVRERFDTVETIVKELLQELAKKRTPVQYVPPAIPVIIEKPEEIKEEGEQEDF